MKLNINNFRNTLKTVLEYLFPVEKVTSYFKSIKSKEDLQKFIQQRSAHVTQTTLYGYLKTRMGHKFTLMVDDEEFSKSINQNAGAPLFLWFFWITKGMLVLGSKKISNLIAQLTFHLHSKYMTLRESLFTLWVFL